MSRDQEPRERRIVPFERPAPRARRTVRDRAAGETGRVLLFTGVQYQRIGAEPEAVLPPDLRAGSDLRVGG